MALAGQRGEVRGACSCVVMFYEAGGRKDRDWRLSVPQSGIREEE